jgi:hypothetical protein
MRLTAVAAPPNMSRRMARATASTASWQSYFARARFAFAAPDRSPQDENPVTGDRRGERA